jgi:hypothetical protein
MRRASAIRIWSFQAERAELLAAPWAIRSIITER